MTGRRWETGRDDTQSVPFGVDDGTGRVAVHLDQAELVLTPGTTYPCLPGYDPSTLGVETHKPDTRYTETLIAEGQELLVVGTIQPISGGNWQFEKGAAPLIVSDLAEGELVAWYRRKARTCWLLAALLGVLGGGALVAGLGGLFWLVVPVLGGLFMLGLSLLVFYLAATRY
jgi:hypothetical protein